MKILTLLSLFSTFLSANSVNIEVSMYSFACSSEYPDIYLFNVEFYLKCLSYVSPMCCHASCHDVEYCCLHEPKLGLKKTVYLFIFLRLFLRIAQGSSSAVVTLTTGLFWWVFIHLFNRHIFSWVYANWVFALHRCVHPDFGSTTVMWPILCPSTEVLRGWAFLTGNCRTMFIILRSKLLCHLQIFNGDNNLLQLDTSIELYIVMKGWVDISLFPWLWCPDIATTDMLEAAKH